MSQTITYNFRTIRPGYLTIITIAIILVDIIMIMWEGVDNITLKDVIRISLPSILFLIVIHIDSRRKEFLSFTEDYIQYNLQHDEGSIKYSHLESIEVGKQEVKIRSMSFPRTFDLSLAKSAEDADAIKNRFRELKKKYIDSN